MQKGGRGGPLTDHERQATSAPELLRAAGKFTGDEPLVASRTVIAPDADLARRTSLEREAEAELDYALGEVGGKAQRRAGGKGAGAVDVEGGEAGRQTEDRAHGVVHAGKVGVVGDVEAFGGELQLGFLGDAMLPAQ